MPVPPPPKPRSRTAKVLTAAAVSTGVGFGTCSLGLYLGEGRLHSLAITAGSCIFFGSLAVLIVTSVILVIQELRKAFRR